MKRAFDIIFSLIGLLAAAPLFPLIALLVKADSKGPALFVHERVGRDFKPFNLYKFRTMQQDPQGAGLPVTAVGDPRITRVGRVLRRTKLDELPQLWNILRGDMSFVGPRPEVTRYVEMFRDDYSDILRVRPGLTDYAAIEFIREEDVLNKYDDAEEGYVSEVLPEKIRLYKKYINSMGFVTDMKLIILTLCRMAR